MHYLREYHRFHGDVGLGNTLESKGPNILDMENSEAFETARGRASQVGIWSPRTLNNFFHWAQDEACHKLMD